jgi:formylglycine-generating enzyme required for sulfatase activity
LIPAGQFTMGAAIPEEIYDSPAHPVRITRPFYLGEFEVTQDEWRMLMSDRPNPSWFSPEATGSGRTVMAGVDTSRHPVESVTWLEAIQFCNRLSEKEKLPAYYAVEGETVSVPDVGGPGYRLPTEAEWEYACRANSEKMWSFGDVEEGLGDHAWFGQNSAEKTHTVGEKRPNPFHLRDMHGNVSEWCWDWDDRYPEESVLVSEDPRGPQTGRLRIIRGGAWNSPVHDSGSARRFALDPTRFNKDTGFRVARSLNAPR